MGAADLNQPAEPLTDDPHVQAAVDRLTELDTVGTDGSVAVYEDIYRSLSSALEGSTGTPPAPE